MCRLFKNIKAPPYIWMSTNLYKWNEVRQKLKLRRHHVCDPLARVKSGKFSQNKHKLLHAQSIKSDRVDPRKCGLRPVYWKSWNSCQANLVSYDPWPSSLTFLKHLCVISEVIKDHRRWWIVAETQIFSMSLCDNRSDCSSVIVFELISYNIEVQSPHVHPGSLT